MIEKLDIKDYKDKEQLVWFGIISKINELVDVVNNLQKHEEQHLDLLTELNEMRLQKNATISKKEKVEPAAPYEEQRRWIGKLCRCWDFDINDDIWGILQDIKDNKTEKYYMYGIGYEHCEPVKPTDSIIYKG